MSGYSNTVWELVDAERTLLLARERGDAARRAVQSTAPDALTIGLHTNHDDRSKVYLRLDTPTGHLQVNPGSEIDRLRDFLNRHFPAPASSQE